MKQTTDALCMCNNFFLMNQDPFNCRIDRTIHEVCASFQTSRRLFLGLSASTIHAQRKCLFLLTLQAIHCFSSMCELITMAGSNFSDSEILWGREVIERKPRISF